MWNNFLNKRKLDKKLNASPIYTSNILHENTHCIIGEKSGRTFKKKMGGKSWPYPNLGGITIGLVFKNMLKQR